MALQLALAKAYEVGVLCLVNPGPESFRDHKAHRESTNSRHDISFRNTVETVVCLTPHTSGCFSALGLKGVDMSFPSTGFILW